MDTIPQRLPTAITIPSALSSSLPIPNPSSSPPHQLVATSSTERDQIEKLFKEVKQLKQKVDTLEKENIALKKSIYDLSARYAAALQQGGIVPRPGPFVIDPEELPQEVVVKTKEVMSKVVQKAGGVTDGYDGVGVNYREKNRDGKPFHMKYELKGHTGAVYTVQFSPHGLLLGSGSFDKTIRLWDTATTQKEVGVLKSHTLNISDLSWTVDSATLLSGAYDQTCKTWDVQTLKLTASFETEGFVQCVGWDHNDTNIFFYGTSRNILAMIDVRATPRAATPRVATATALPVSSSTGPAPTAVFIRNDAMINTLYVSRDGVHVTTGDSQGYLKVWDIRNRECIVSILNEPGKTPISNIVVGRRYGFSGSAVDDDDEPRYMAVNSYDNMMRVYDRGINPPTSPSRLVHALKGFKNKNWPIKSSFYCGLEYQPSIQRRPIPAHDDLYGDADTNLAVDASFSKEKPPERSVLLATGSADPYAYLYNVGENSAELMQRLEGHTDRVYAVHFHPIEPILASCSADFTVKIWGPTKKKNVG